MIDKPVCPKCKSFVKKSTRTCSRCGFPLVNFDFKQELQKQILEQPKPGYFSLYADLYIKPILNIVREIDTGLETITEKFTEKQLEIFNNMIGEGWVALLGSRKTGKTFLMASGIILLGSKKKIEVHILSSKKETASHVIYMILDICGDLGLDIIERPAKEQITFKNGTRIKAHSNTLADTGTYEADILVMDEAQEIEEEVWAKIVPQLATGRKMRVWIMGTAKAGTPFHQFWFEENKRFKKHEMRMEDATWVSEEDWEAVKSLMSDRMVRQELNMQWVEPEGAYFKASEIEEAYVECIVPEDLGEIVCGVDWGFGHMTTMIVLGIKGKKIYELDSWGMHNPNEKEIVAKAQTFYEKYNPLFILEGGQMFATHIQGELESRNIRTEMSMFGNNKDRFWTALDLTLGMKKLSLINPHLKQQLLRYCGDKKDDDWADALFHAVKYFFDKYLYQEAVDFYKKMYGENV